MRHLPLVVCLGLAGLVACTAPTTPATGGSVDESSSSGECKLAWRAPEPQEGGSVAPFSLTAQDGTGLELLAVKSRAYVEDPLAFTELHLTFRNPNDRVIEGRFEINLPPNSAISRFAMLIDGRWQEAEVVELQAARAAYEDFLHRRQDPALLEKAAGNRFSARVFPIPARGVKEIIVSYSEELTASGAPYRLYLRGLPQLDDLDVEVIVPRGGGVSERTSVKKRAFMPQQDLELQTPRRSAEVGLRHDRLAVARIAPDVKLPQVPLTGVTLLFDTSASRALDFDGQLARLVTLIGELRAAGGTDFALTVACFDQTVETVFAGPASSFTTDALQAIRRRGALGASDLTGALRWLAAQKPHDRVIVVGDGIATAGDTEGEALRKAAGDLARAGVRRLDAVVDGGLRDEAALRQLTTAGLEQAGILVDARQPAPLVASRLLRATIAGTKVHVPGATWLWPTSLDAVQPGDQFLVFADLPADMAMRVELDHPSASAGPDGVPDDVREIALTASARPLLERAWIRASIDRLTGMMADEAAGDDQAKAELKRQIIELSTRYRVLSDYTALLVLETDWDYQRFGISRTALAEILTVGPDGLAVVDRTRLPEKPAFEPPPEPEEPSLVNQLFGDREEAPPPDDANAGGEGQRHRGEEGKMGKPTAKNKSGLYAMRGPADAPQLEEAPAGEIALDTVAGLPATADLAPALIEAEPAPATMREPPRPKPAKRDDAKGSSGSAKKVERNINRPLPQPEPRPLVRDPWSPRPNIEQPKPADAWDGRFAEVMNELRAGRPADGLARAQAWRDSNPGDELALLALGEAAEALGDRVLAARAYGSLIDLFPGRADLRRMAGERLEALGDAGLALAIDTYRQAVAQRPDHPASHRLYAFALLKAGRHAEAFAAALAGAQRSYPSGRFRGVDQILREDLGLIAAAWAAAAPGDKDMRAALDAARVSPDAQPTLRFVLNWETDANDVDFHIYDGQGGHAYYGSKRLPSGGELYADVTTGYGPECFTIPGPAAAFPYVLQAHYFSRGPMGYGMGKLQAIEHDGKGHIFFMEHPFVIMKDRAFVDLGHVDRPLHQAPAGAARLPTGPAPTLEPGPYTPPPPPPLPR